MLSNYIKIALRTLTKNKVHSLINIIGLTLGITSVFLIGLYIQHETGYDKYYDGYENLYRITWNSDNPQTRTPHPMAQALVSDFPEVESAVSLSPIWAPGLTRETFSIRNLEKNLRFDESNVLAVDTTFFDVFRFPVIRGNAKHALKNINAVLISESMAKKYFGDEDPIGKRLAINSDTLFVEVMAVFKDVPKQSHFHFDFLTSYVREKSFDPDDDYYTWSDFGHFNYVRLKPGVNVSELENKLMPWVRRYIDITDEEYQNAKAIGVGFRIQPLTDIHLKSRLRWELEPNGNIEYVYIMAAAALLTLVIACINFMNLMTAKSAERAKEIGIRKTLGAARRQLSFQFLGESVMMTLISIFFAVFLAEALLPFYNSITGQAFMFDYVEVVPVLLLFGIFIGLGSGIYPSVILSSIKPTTILKGGHQTGKGGGLRKALIIVQFIISMVLISGSLIISNQLQFIRDKNLGFEKEEVLVVPLRDEAVRPRMEALKSELKRIEGITSVSASSNLPGGQFNQNPIHAAKAPDLVINSSEAYVDYDILHVLNIDLVSGRFFNPENRADSIASFVINETAARQLQLTDPIGEELRWDVGDTLVGGKIIGVMKDFNYQSLHNPMRPLLFVLYPYYNHLIIKLKTDHLEEKLSQIERVYKEFDPVFDFEFSFLDDQLNKQYQSEQNTSTVFSIFSVVAIAIACFGLFGMALLSFHLRIKEVSIRKVLGATLTNLIILLIRDFTKLIAIAILIGIPIAWWMMDRWMDNFIYQVGIQPLVFLISGIVLLGIAWITLSYFTLRISQLNPTETLKSE